MLVYTFFIRILGNRPGITYFLNFWLKFGLFLHVYRSSFYFTAYHFILPFVTFAHFNRLCIHTFVV